MPLEQFSPPVRDWFAGNLGAPTDVQRRVWPLVAAGEHVLATAPTGSGKTLAAFLWALDRYATGAWPRGQPGVLYVSPLKALNNDVRRNLLRPLRGIGGPLADVSVFVRSGDTPAGERQRMLRRPPEILVTTPESLHLLLSSPRARGVLSGVRSVVLDEIHAVAGSKRGTLLMTAVERLTELAGEFQRIALSATVAPLDRVAAFVGGDRPVRVAASEDEKKLVLSVHGARRGDADSVWPAIVRALRESIAVHRSTLVFVNNRALAEKLARWLNETEEEPVAYAHHGSLSRELRALVEGKLKRGELKALVATSSLELGIDIGDLDEVVLVQSPHGFSAAVQRVGRAGHGVGETSRGRLFATHPRDALDAAVLAPAVEARACEPVRPPKNPLDVLAQVLVAMCAVEDRDLDATWTLLRRSAPYRDLSREAFDGVVAMLRGRYEGTRIRELRPRLRIDPLTGRARAAAARALVYRSGGVIPDRGYYTLRVEGSGQKLGELDEEFVWERRLSHEFALGAQVWRVVSITRDDVVVRPGTGARASAAFWKGERPPRDGGFCDRIGAFLEEAEQAYQGGAGAREAFHAKLRAEHRLDEEAASLLEEFLARQRTVTGAPLPHRSHVVVEESREGGEADARRVVVHARWGARATRPWAIALAAAWEEETGVALDVYANDDGVFVHLPPDADPEHLFALVTPESLEARLRGRLEQTGFFGTRFRENAQRALLLPRYGRRRRVPLWLNRLRAGKLLQAARRFGDFPVLAETWRACLEDEFDLERLRAQLDGIRTGDIAVTRVTTDSPSPFAEELVWGGTNETMYDQIERARAPGGAGVSEQALRAVLSDAALRPRLDPELVATFEARLQRTAPGWEPRDDAEWVDLAGECLLLDAAPDPLPEGLARWRGQVAPAERVARFERARRGDDEVLRQLVKEWLAARGPVSAARVAAAWGVSFERAEAVLERLFGDADAIRDRFTRDAAETEYVDHENLERLLRLARADRRPAVAARPLAELPFRLARRQGIVGRPPGKTGDAGDTLRAALERLFGYVAPAALWEEAILPARVPGYAPADFDALFAQSDLVWFGGGRERVGLCFEGDLPLFVAPAPAPPFLGPGRHDFFELQKRSGLDSAALTEALWGAAWDGAVLHDSFAGLRRGLAAGFTPAAPRRARRGLRRWQSTRPLEGTWRAPDPAAFAADALQEAEDDRARARQLLARYGVVFRELLGNEPPLLRWWRQFKAFRLLELAGECVAGSFYRELDGVQFAAPEVARRWNEPVNADAAYWTNACDPASPCGVLAGLPPRVPSTWLCWRGARLVAVARRRGRRLEAEEAPPDGFWDAVGRGVRTLTIETVNGEPASSSPLAGALREQGFEPDRQALVRFRIS